MSFRIDATNQRTTSSDTNTNPELKRSHSNSNFQELLKNNIHSRNSYPPPKRQRTYARQRSDKVIEMINHTPVVKNIFDQINKKKEINNLDQNRIPILPYSHYFLKDLLKNNEIEDYLKMALVIELLENHFDDTNPKVENISFYLPENIIIFKKTNQEYQGFFKSLKVDRIPQEMQRRELPEKNSSNRRHSHHEMKLDYFFAVGKFLEKLFPENMNEDLTKLKNLLIASSTIPWTITWLQSELKDIQAKMKRNRPQLINLKFDYVKEIQYS
jgi:hypothetical protein